jgi:ribosomal protein S18 acetylase RimI-like enzyme
MSRNENWQSNARAIGGSFGIEECDVLIRRAIGTDAELLVEQSVAFNAEDGHPLSAEGIKALLHMLEPDFADGLVLLLTIGGRSCGHGVLSFGYGIEYGGRETFLEEIYIAPKYRGFGLGGILIDALEASARDSGCRAVHLEVMAGNRAERLYRRMGYGDRGSMLLTKKI